MSASDPATGSERKYSKKTISLSAAPPRLHWQSVGAPGCSRGEEGEPRAQTGGGSRWTGGKGWRGGDRSSLRVSRVVSCCWLRRAMEAVWGLKASSDESETARSVALLWRDVYTREGGSPMIADHGMSESEQCSHNITP